jgi:hypothetical protein
MKAYKIKGTTNDVTTCELCGRPELKGTVMLAPLDVDGNEDGDVSYFGTSCAAKASGWTVREVNAGVKAAKVQAASEERNRVIAEREAENKAYIRWVQETYGTGATLKAAVQEFGLVGLRKQFLAARDAVDEATEPVTVDAAQAVPFVIEPRGMVYRNDGTCFQWMRVINGKVFHFALYGPVDYWQSGVTCRVYSHPYGNVFEKTVVHKNMHVTEYVAPAARAA